MQFSTLALALAGAAIAKAAVLERGVIPGSEFAHNRFELHAKATFTRPGSVTLVNEVPTPKFDLGTRGGIAVRAANYMTDNCIFLPFPYAV